MTIEMKGFNFQDFQKLLSNVGYILIHGTGIFAYIDPIKKTSIHVSKHTIFPWIRHVK